MHIFTPIKSLHSKSETSELNFIFFADIGFVIIYLTIRVSLFEKSNFSGIINLTSVPEPLILNFPVISKG